MKKLTKSTILQIPLTALGIRLVTNWVTREERALNKAILGHRRLNPGIPPDERAQVEEERFREEIRRVRMQMRTVGELVKAYPYRLAQQMFINGRWVYIGIGAAPIAELKRRLLDLGLKPSHWPALVERDQFFAQLSKRTVLGLPILEVLRLNRWGRSLLEDYLGCKELECKTLRDFLRVRPDRSGHNGKILFKRHKAALIRLRQELAANGFANRKGFFTWDPDKASLQKARRRLRKYGLSPKLLRQVVRIAVSERWVR